MKNEKFTPERIKAEADTFFEWDGEDRSLVTTTSCLLFAQHIAGLMQARAAQPAPVVPEGWSARLIKDGDAAGYVVSTPQDEAGVRSNTSVWADDDDPAHAMLWHMLAAAPAQGQQVECQECQGCERLHDELDEVTADRDGCAYQRDQLLAELSALKAQQVGQEPVAIANKGDHAFWVKWTDAGKDLRGPGIKLYTAPQPAPAQDVAGLVEALRVAAPYVEAKFASEQDRYAEEYARLPETAQVRADIAKVRASLAAHDKQSGEDA